MSLGGTASYEGASDLPPRVARAVSLARSLSFEYSCRLEQGRLLALLAAGRRGGRIGETGTGCGVGLAWLREGAGESSSIVSIERDVARASACRLMFAADENVTVLRGEWDGLLERGPFDLLVLDGGGAGKSGDFAPVSAIGLGGCLVVDDFTPLESWPPLHEGEPDGARLHWLEHPELCSTELRLAPDLATVVGIRVR